METAITKGIKVSVETFYQEKQSAQTGQFVFAYRITIENGSNNTIQLLRRHWHIYDIHKSWREVEGEGVIGEQPILRPSEQHQYISGVFLNTDIGQMFGTYLMQNQVDNSLFQVRVPLFNLVTPYRMS